MTEEKESALNVDHFLSLVRKYTDIQELTAEIIQEFIEKSMYTRQSALMADEYSVLILERGMLIKGIKPVKGSEL